MTTTTLRQLDIFAQMVASENIVDCARALGVSPATVESDMHTLEERLGFQLFFVDGRSIRLTPAGRKAVEAMAQLSGVDNPVVVPEQVPPDPANDRLEAAGPEEAVPEPVAPSLEEEFPAEEMEPEPLDLASEPETDRAELPSPEEMLCVVEEAAEVALPPEGEQAEAEAAVEEEPALTLREDDVLPPEAEEELELTEALPAEGEASADAGGLEEQSEPPVAVSVSFATSMSRPATWFARGQWIRVSPPPVMEAPQPHAGIAVPLPRLADIEREGARPLPEPPPVPEEQAEPARRQVTIAAHPSIFGHFQDMLAAFEQGNSDVGIRLDLGAFTAETVAERFASGDADIAYFHAVGDPDGLRSRYVWSERLSLYVGEDHPLAARDQVGADDMRLARPALLDAANPLRPLIERALSKAGLACDWPAMESDDVFQLLNAVRGGLGYFAAFGPLARDFGKMDGIRRLPFVDPLPPIEIRQSVREEVADDPVVSSLAEYLFR